MIFHRATTIIPLVSSLLLILAITGCSSSSSGGGVFGQTFNVSGQWSGTITETTGVARAATVTFADSGGTVTGTISVVGHTCFSGGNLTGTSSQAPANTTDDNPLTADQENSNLGSVNVSLASGQTSGGISAVTISSGGSGYVEPPVVIFGTPTSEGRSATGIAVLGTDATSDQVASVIITDPGSGYIFGPAVTFSGGEGSGAIGTTTLDASTITDSVTMNLVGSSSSLNGTYSGVWKGSSSECSAQTSGNIRLTRL